ncbi:MAG: SulP family inorganic anion transporter [Bacteroidales bacterium]|nr:SulP family inorganic anion transporter [Lentimicrobiaceae bacterium]MDD5696177.1 SulP family inorganic anion transporter [Bacteroidales bacterium]
MKDKIKQLIPVADWLPKYSRKYLQWDLLAGITLAFFVIPESMAYATLAGLPPQMGIYCYVFAGLLYFVFGTSRQLAIGPTSAISLVVGTTIATLSGGDPAQAVVLASGTALIMAVMFFIAWLVRLSALVSFISDTILVGFKAGAALVIASTQLPKLFGFHGQGSDFFERIAYLFTHLGATRPEVLVFGLIALFLLIMGDRLLPGKPVSLAVVILSILAVSFTPLQHSGIPTVGEIPRGIPSLHIPLLEFSVGRDLVPLAMACFLLSYVESISAARALAGKNGHEVNPRQELLALGAANLAAAVGRGYPVAGGLSQSTVNSQAGAKTPLTLIIMSVLLMICLLFLTGLIRNLPEVILAAIVLHAVIGLIKVKEMKHLFRVSQYEFRIMVITILTVMVFGILQGVLFAVLLSIVTLLRKSSAPHIAILGRIKGTSRFSDILRHPENEPVEGLLILRVESSIIYFNVSHIHEGIRQILKEQVNPVKMLIMDLSSANYVDIAGTRFLLELEDELLKKGIDFTIVEALGRVRDILRIEGMEKEIGHISRKVDLEDAVEAFLMKDTVGG